jgi:hypothetical protein
VLIAASGLVNALDNAANNFFVTGLQIEVGSIATAFERRPFGEELALCQRYYCKTFPYATAPADDATTGGAIQGKMVTSNVASPGVVWHFPVEMRATPTLTTYNTGAGTAGEWSNNSGSVSANLRTQFASTSGVNIDNTGTTLTAANAYYVQLRAVAEL